MSFESENKTFGVVIFDDVEDPSAGWACLTGDKDSKPKRISSINDLSTGSIWWCNIEYNVFFSKTEMFRHSWLRYSKYLIVNHNDVLKEWGYDPKFVDPAFVAKFCAQQFTKIMRLSFRLIKEVNYKAKMDTSFVSSTLREDLRCLLPEPEYPRGEAASIMKYGKAIEEITMLASKFIKDAKLITLRRPRLFHAMEMLQTPVPKGPFEFNSRMSLREKSPDKVSFIANSIQPCMTEISIERTDPEIAPIYAFGVTKSKNNRLTRSWVSHPEFVALERFSEIDVKSAWIGKEYGSLFSNINDSVKEFLGDRFNEYSWTAGIIADTIWRTATLSESKNKVFGPRTDEEDAKTSWQGAWIKSSDKVVMFSIALDLVKRGYSVLAYGQGWIRCSVSEEMVYDFINDGLSLGLLPNMYDIPKNLFPSNARISWGGDKRSHMVAHLLVTLNKDMIWNLDKVVFMNKSEDKKRLIQHLLEKK